MSSPWFRMDELLKCSACAGRFRNPKLLPCNHTLCAEPCLARCVERGQARCPECAAEHRLPLKGFPNNVTLVRFLELRQQVSGREPELPASMQRCGACKERGALQPCAHCGRKVCPECRAAHVGILRREIALINGEVRQGLTQLSLALRSTEENAEKLQKNYHQVKDEIEEVVRRYNRDLLDTESKLKHHLDTYLASELRSMRRLEHDLQVELSNVNSNCDLVDKYVNNGVDWTDAELTDYKEIFQKTLEFLRAFDSDPTDCIRKVKFHPRSDPDVIHKTLIEFAEVKLSEDVPNNNNSVENMYNSTSNLNGPTVTLTPPQGLSRSQSDHKLCSQRQSQKRKDKTQNEDIEPLSRRFRDRFVREKESESDSRDHSPSSWRRELDEARRCDEPDDAEPRNRSPTSPVRDRVGETEDATRGPLSGVMRILDCPRVMERLHHSAARQRRQREEEQRRARVPPPPAPPPRHVARQLSEDEVEKQKKENKAAAAKASPSAESPRSPKPSILKKDDVRPKYPSPRSPDESRSPSDDSQRRAPREEPRVRSWRSALVDKEDTPSPPASPTRTHKPPVSPRLPAVNVTRPTSRFLPRNAPQEQDDSESGRRKEERPALRLAIRPAARSPSPSSSSSSDSDDSDAVTRRGDISPSVHTLLARSAQARKQSASTQARILGRQDDRRPGHRSWRDDEASKDGISSSRRKTSVTEPEEKVLPYSRFLERRRSSINSGTGRTREVSPEDYASRKNRIARSKSSHDLCPALRDDSPEDDTLTAIRNRYRTRRNRDPSPEDVPPPHSWSQYMKNKYGGRAASGSASSGLMRSRTSASLVARSDSDDSSDAEPRRRDSGVPRRTYLQKGKSSFKFGSRGTEHGCFTWPRGVCVGSDNTVVVADSNNHRVQVFQSSGKFVQEFGSYGSAEGEFDCLAGVAVNRIGQFIVSDRYNHRLQVFDPSGRFVRAFGCEGRADGKFSYPWGVATDNLGFIYVCDKENHRIQVFQGDGTYVTRFGGIGQRPGELEHPHYVAVSTTNRVIVSDSHNHRVQVFDVNGRLLSAFGSEGSGEGQFKYPRGVAVDDQGYLVVGDSGNNRVQIFHPDGTFLKAFGTWGSGDGEFKGLEGIAVSPTGQILACDRENHRIQVF